MDVAVVARDLAIEHDALELLIAELDDVDWKLPTPSPRWSVADQIAHLTYFDETAVIALIDPTRFEALAHELAGAASQGDEALDEFTLGELRPLDPPSLVARWREARIRLGEAATQLSNDQRVPWYGPSMGSTSFLTARLMETWAHGQDIVDATGLSRVPTERLRHVANLGFMTRSWTYRNRGLDVPDDAVRVELNAPSGEIWAFGPPDAAEVVTGPAEDFCLVVTQRRHLDDTKLVATPVARDWMLKAQAFAGAPTDGPAKGTRT